MVSTQASPRSYLTSSAGLASGITSCHPYVEIPPQGGLQGLRVKRDYFLAACPPLSLSYESGNRGRKPRDAVMLLQSFPYM